MLRYRCAALVFVLSALVVRAADPSAGALPEGAKFRLGSTRATSSSTGSKNAPDAVRLGVFTPAGEHILGAQPDGKLAFVDPATWQVTRTVAAGVEANELPLSVASISADGKRAAAVGAKSVVVLSTEDGKLLARVPRQVMPTGTHVSLSADGKRVAVGPEKFQADVNKLGIPATVLVWDVDADKQLTSVQPAQKATTTPTLSPDGKRLITWHGTTTKAGGAWGGGAGGFGKAVPKDDVPDAARALQLWDTETGKEVSKTWIGERAAPVSVAFSPDGSRVAASTGDGTIFLLDPTTGEEKATLLGRVGQGQRLVFSRDGKKVAAAGDDGAVQIWGTANERLLQTTESPFPRTATERLSEQAVRALAFVDGDRVRVWLWRAEPSTVWETPAGKPLVAPAGHPGPVTSIATTAEGDAWVTATKDGHVIRWDAKTGTRIGAQRLIPPARKLGNNTESLSTVAISPGANWALGEALLSPHCVYSLRTGTQQFALGADASAVFRNLTAFSADGTNVLAATNRPNQQEKNRITLWDVTATKRIRTFELPAEYTRITATALSPDGSVALTAGIRRQIGEAPAGYVIAAWDVATGKNACEVTIDSAGAKWHLAAIDNTTAVVAPPTGPVLIVDYKAGGKPRELDVPDRAPVTPAVSVDGKTVAILISRTEKQAAGVQLFDVATGKLKKTFTGIGGQPTAVAFSGNGKSLLTGSDDTTVLVWDLTKP